MSGHLLMLLLITEENADGTITVKKPKVELLGKVYNNIFKFVHKSDTIKMNSILVLLYR